MSQQPLDEKRQVLFLDPRLGWTETETPEARLRMRSKWRSQASVFVENELQVQYERGGWNDVSSAQLAQMTGHDQGWSFTMRPRQGETQPFVEITSARYVDAAMAEALLRGIELFDADLKPLGSPQLAADRFCIPSVQAQTFIDRVKSRNGSVSEAQADLHDMHHKATARMPQIAQELEALCKASREVIDQVAGGVQTEVPSIQERCRTAHQLREQATGLLAKLRDEQAAADRNAGQVEFQGHAAAYVQHAEQWMQRVEQLHREHMSYEVQAKMRAQASLSQSLPEVSSPSSQRRYLLMPVVEYYTDLGLDARLTKDGMVLAMDGVVIELGETPTVRTQDGTMTADKLTGRRGAERTQRSL